MQIHEVNKLQTFQSICCQHDDLFINDIYDTLCMKMDLILGCVNMMQVNILDYTIVCKYFTKYILHHNILETFYKPVVST